MASLASYIQSKGGQLPPGWTVKLAVRSNGKVMKTFVSPAGRKFSGPLAVARELGLAAGAVLGRLCVCMGGFICVAQAACACDMCAIF